MGALTWTQGGQSVISDGGNAATLRYDYTAESGDRHYGIASDPVILRVSAGSILKLNERAASIDSAKHRAQGLEDIKLAPDDKLITIIVHDVEDACQREEIAKVQAATFIGQGQEVHNLRVSLTSLAHGAAGLSQYDVAFKVRTRPTPFVGGIQVYP